MTSRELLLKNPDLQNWWNAIASDKRFDEMCLIMGMDICKLRPPEKIDGAMACLESLKNIALPEPAEPKQPSSGLQHDFTKVKEAR